MRLGEQCRAVCHYISNSVHEREDTTKWWYSHDQWAQFSLLTNKNTTWHVGSWLFFFFLTRSKLAITICSHWSVSLSSINYKRMTVPVKWAGWIAVNNSHLSYFKTEQWATISYVILHPHHCGVNWGEGHRQKHQNSRPASVSMWFEGNTKCHKPFIWTAMTMTLRAGKLNPHFYKSRTRIKTKYTSPVGRY